jgi:hypothetical protein
MNNVGGKLIMLYFLLVLLNLMREYDICLMPNAVFTVLK